LLVAASIGAFSAMPKNPLRRLSVALRLTEAYQPAETASTPTTSLSLFLSNSKAAFLKDVKEDRAKAAGWTVVMGNEAGGTFFLLTIQIFFFERLVNRS
jgi:hypothetical protein